MNAPLTAGGAFFAIEGAANIIYWWNDHHPWYFQMGRLIRTVLGITFVIGGFIL